MARAVLAGGYGPFGSPLGLRAGGRRVDRRRRLVAVRRLFAVRPLVGLGLGAAPKRVVVPSEAERAVLPLREYREPLDADVVDLELGLRAPAKVRGAEEEPVRRRHVSGE